MESLVHGFIVFLPVVRPEDKFNVSVRLDVAVNWTERLSLNAMGSLSMDYGVMKICSD